MIINTHFELIASRPPLFEHQKEACASVLAELKIADRCKLRMACATGKTRVGVEIAMAQQARTAVIFLPSLALVRQTLPYWISAPFEGGISYLCVCSDKTVTKGDEPIVTVDEFISEFGLTRKGVTTRGGDVRDFLTLTGFDGVRVVFSTYQSSDVVRDGCPEGFRFDLGIFDEAHRTAGKQSAFSAPLFDSHTPIAKRVFMTATPKHFDYRHRGRNGEVKPVFSMDNETVYGRITYKLSIRQAIDRNLIAGYQVLVSVIDDKNISKDWKIAESWVENNESVAYALAIRAAMDKFELQKVVTFHDSVADAKRFAESPIVQAELGVQMFHVNGSIPTNVRSEIMAKFAAAPTGVVTNARCLTEGVDVPEIDMVVFLHPRKSHVDIIQAIGRALRLPRGSAKTTGYILLPLYMSEIENGGFERALKKYGYDTIWQVIQALREQDEVVENELREAVIGMTLGEPRNLDVIHVMGPAIYLDMLRRGISTHCIEALGESWWGMFAILERFYREGRSGSVTQRAVVDGVQIGSWVSAQREDHRAGRLSAERTSALESIGFKWQVRDEEWEERFAILERLHRDGRDVNLVDRIVIDGIRIGLWVKNQRKRYKVGKLSSARITRLESMGLKLDVLDMKWEKNFSILERLYREGKDVNLGCGVIISEIKIGEWIQSQRVSHKAGTLSANRTTRLESIGFRWSLPEAAWEKRFSILERFFRKGKNVNFAKYTVIDGILIGGWVRTQRKNYKAGKLSADRIARLEAIGFKWSMK